MDAMLQRHCARYIYVIPDGLRELMSDISREVLRSQPEDVYTFIADYLDALMVTRENARVAARLVESLTEMATTTATFLQETGMPRDEVDDIVAAIQKVFKKSIESENEKEEVSEELKEVNIISDIMAEIKVSPEQAEMAAIIIQQAYRRFKERKEREKELFAGMIDWRVAARSAIRLYRNTGVTNEEANRAATLIKAAYKGYYTRKAIKKMAALEQENLMQEVQYEIPDYLRAIANEQEDEEEGEFTTKVSSIVERTRSVKIDYSTVIPHVDFDTVATDQSSRTSTASSIVKHSLKYIFDNAVEKINRQSTIPEETAEMSDVLVADLADATMPVTTLVETEIRQDNLEIDRSGSVNVSKGSQSRSLEKEPSLHFASDKDNQAE